MKVKDLIKKLQQYDPESYVSVKYYGQYDCDSTFDDIDRVEAQYCSITHSLSPLIICDSVVHVEEENDE